MKFYHLTTVKALPTILEQGLDPERSESSLEAVFLTTCSGTAQGYLGMHNESCVLLEVNIDTAKHDLGPDNYELKGLLADMDETELEEYDLFEGATWNDCSWEQSLAICNQVACYTVIAPLDIQVLKTFAGQ